MENTEQITVTSVADVPWPDVRTVFGTRGYPSRCWCQYFKPPTSGWKQGTPEECSALLRQQVVANAHAPGLIAYVGDEPAGWCAIEPRPNYSRLRRTKVVTQGSREDPDDASVWAVTCFVVRIGFRRRRVANALLAGAVDHARLHGARIVEAYPVDVSARPDAAAADLYHGALSQFVKASFDVVSHPTDHRAVVQLTL
ncbi:hypothetical protein GY21_15950 [Cryobacterium roopkundense]|uniref:N-acetyltransferase domain-containing protein n=1 Tax=Cryobacterium roopkundense TaxID=1001240 RepID=A0A099J4G0_9MICO|nr:GNAT family N-acetyltransferase [Cryobacterium roopkundense]KGJ72348.1 hypothetical protein GY21_15950 [Cryobacterium roopkundense]MBB5640421.1 hypothetical protein [Cryobacterium roopkundense]